MSAVLLLIGIIWVLAIIFSLKAFKTGAVPGPLAVIGILFGPLGLALIIAWPREPIDGDD